MTRLVAVLIGGIACLPAFLAGQPAPVSPDEKVLEAAKLPTDTPGLLELFRLRAHHDSDETQLKQWVEQLGKGSFQEREQASKQLLLRGPVALPYLRPSLKSGTLEIVRRAEALI